MAQRRRNRAVSSDRPDFVFGTEVVQEFSADLAEEALDAAVAAYEMPHYTFCFARDLTGGQERQFRQRLIGRHAGVTVDYWGHRGCSAPCSARRGESASPITSIRTQPETPTR